MQLLIMSYCFLSISQEQIRFIIEDYLRIVFNSSLSCCCSLKPPRRFNSNEHQQRMFFMENLKYCILIINNYTSYLFILSIVKYKKIICLSLHQYDISESAFRKSGTSSTAP